eukprot:1990575-Amphidinium_carterae.1
MRWTVPSVVCGLIASVQLSYKSCLVEDGQDASMSQSSAARINPVWRAGSETNKEDRRRRIHQMLASGKGR